MKVEQKNVSYTNSKEALRDADFVINAIQVGGYEPSTVIDFEIPKKYGLKQTIGDTIGIGGIMRGLITNLSKDSCVEVSCLVDKNGIQLTYVGDLPTQLASLNRTNINVHELTVEAVVTGDRDKVYQAAMLDPHTSSELSIPDIKSIVDELIDAHVDYVPMFN